MPEEHNRIVTDLLSDLYFITERVAEKNLRDENRDVSRIYFVGNTMIDTLVIYEKEIEDSNIMGTLNLTKGKFVLVTMHRPGNVDNKAEFEKLLTLINHLSEKYIVVFPMHPKTAKSAQKFGLYEKMCQKKDLICTEPMNYFSFQKLIKNCAFVVTDSGGIQEETTFRGKPCLTLRPNTERPVTVEKGTNTLLGFDVDLVKTYISQIEDGSYKKGTIPELWDGKATERILKIIAGHS
jgi:UDP-N-acetylglucosamine 2-epimerase (non-hydrolysing)